VQRGDVVPVDDQDVIERGPQARKEARARRLERFVRQLQAGRVQAPVRESVGAREVAEVFEQCAHS
jgi:hypothetical protein